MELSQLNKIKKGRIIVNICIILIILNRAWSFIDKISKGNRDLITGEGILSCIFLGIIVCYYLGNKSAFNFIIGFVPIVLAILPFFLIIPFMYIFDMLIYPRLGEWAITVEVVFYIIGLIAIYVLFKRFELFRCVQEYKKFSSSSQTERKL